MSSDRVKVNEVVGTFIALRGTLFDDQGVPCLAVRCSRHNEGDGVCRVEFRAGTVREIEVVIPEVTFVGAVTGG